MPSPPTPLVGARGRGRARDDAGRARDGRQERHGLSAAIAAVRNAGIAPVRTITDAAVGEVRRAAAQFEHPTTEAGELGPHVRMAQALATPSRGRPWSRRPGRSS